jgi:hypothetical protein
MYYGGESNVPGAPGNFGNAGSIAVHPQPIDERTRDLMNLQQQNPELYKKLLEQKKVEGFAQPGGIPGMPGNSMGMQIADATFRGVSPPQPVPPALRRDMQGTQLVPQPDGSYIHPHLAGSENEAYRKRFIEATKNR